ncbi:MAG: cytochrome c, partial [Planctomycetes bacterium]|nr:cytochrome c [Planctomycetota bacterium]
HQAADNIAKLPKTELKREEKPKYGRMITARRLFSRYNCGNCHSLGKHRIIIQRDEDGKIVFQPGAERAPDLTNAHERLRPEWLHAMLTHPPTWMPWSRMPELDIEEEDIDDLAWYVMNFRER